MGKLILWGLLGVFCTYCVCAIGAVIFSCFSDDRKKIGGLRKIIERGVRDHSGGQVEYQVYKTDDRSLEEILAEMRRAEIRIANDHLKMISLDVARKLAKGVKKLWDSLVNRRRP